MVQSDIKKLDIVSMGVEGSSLPVAAINAIQKADVILGAEHHFTALLNLPVNMPVSTLVHGQSGVSYEGKKALYVSPFSEVKQQLLSFTGNVVVLASGDSLFFGIGQWIKNEFSSLNLAFHPNISSIQAACHLIGKPWQALSVLSAHGRPLGNIRSQLKNNGLYGIFTDKNSDPYSISTLLVTSGYENSTLWICEAIGTSEQKVSSYDVQQLHNQEEPFIQAFNPLHVTIFETSGSGNVLPEFPGIPDRNFSTDGDVQGTGLLTKREVRINILSLLQPTAREVGWDIGAGCGGVSVEWARWNPSGELYSIEYHPDRLRHLKENQQRFGVGKNLHIIEGRAPEATIDLPAPQKIFIGGSSGEMPSLLQYCWDRLKSNGKLVIACVTETNKARALSFLDNVASEDCTAEITQVSVSKGDSIASHLILRPQLPVLLIALTKHNATTNTDTLSNRKHSK